MMRYDEKCQLDHTMPLNNPCTRYNTPLATLVIINLCTVMMSQSGDITVMELEQLRANIFNVNRFKILCKGRDTFNK
jgi:hypothetical protein